MAITTKPTVTLTGAIIKETAAAILFEVNDRGEHWFPLSTIWEIHLSQEILGDEIVVDEWIAKKKGLVEK